MKIFLKRLFILDPTGNPPEIETVKPANRPSSLDGIRLGLLDITKPNSDKLLQRLEENLQRKYSIRSFSHYRKKGAARPSDKDVIDQIKQECDFIVIAAPD